MNPACGEGLRFENIHQRRRAVDGSVVEILRGVELEVAAASLTVIVGPSGGGKSTLVRLVNRLEDPACGRILLAGDDIARIDPLQLRRRVGVQLQTPFMYAGTVLENLQRPFVFRREPAPAADDTGLLRLLELCRLSSELLPRQARSLSVGQQQRVGLVRALLGAPTVLALDEPTSALDRPTADQLGQTLQTICRRHGISILLLTHDLLLAQRVADRAAFLHQGRILETAAGADFFNRPRCAELQDFLAAPADPGEVDRDG
ncbi:MAG: ATP-binding cassette domain-containing protein [Desulfuromonadaceae bacterium]